MGVLRSPAIKIAQSPSVSVNWSWYDQQNGIVQWDFQNNADITQSVALLRGATDQSGKVFTYYYFGNAYWPVYLSLGITQWQTQNQPLQDQGVQNNAPPLAVFKVADKYLIAFVFTLPSQTTWSMLEGGFGSGIQPYNPIAINVEYEGDHYFCIGYDYQQVLDYVEQTGIPVFSYQPNPQSFKVSLYKINGPYIELFDDKIQRGVCPNVSWFDRIRNFFKRVC
jgi:hypothetical protein